MAGPYSEPRPLDAVREIPVGRVRRSSRVAVVAGALAGLLLVML